MKWNLRRGKFGLKKKFRPSSLRITKEVRASWRVLRCRHARQWVCICIIFCCFLGHPLLFSCSFLVWCLEDSLRVLWEKNWVVWCFFFLRGVGIPRPRVCCCRCSCTKPAYSQTQHQRAPHKKEFGLGAETPRAQEWACNPPRCSSHWWSTLQTCQNVSLFTPFFYTHLISIHSLTTHSSSRAMMFLILTSVLTLQFNWWTKQLSTHPPIPYTPSQTHHTHLLYTSYLI